MSDKFFTDNAEFDRSIASLRDEIQKFRTGALRFLRENPEGLSVGKALDLGFTRLRSAGSIGIAGLVDDGLVEVDEARKITLTKEGRDAPVE